MVGERDGEKERGSEQAVMWVSHTIAQGYSQPSV